MKPNRRYHHLVHPVMTAGVAFVTAYEIENFPAVTVVDSSGSPATGARGRFIPERVSRVAARLLEPFRRRIALLTRRKAVV